MRRRENAVSRQLGCIACRACGGGLLFHTLEETLTCPSCGATTPVPKSIGEDLEHGRKLKIDLQTEATSALDETVEALLEVFSLRTRWVLLAGAVNAAYFSFDYHATAVQPAWSDYLIGALLGFIAVALPLGWTLSWFEGTGLQGAQDQSRRWLRAQADTCPHCEHPFFGEGTPGLFACAKCGRDVAHTPELSVAAEEPRNTAFESTAHEQLEGAPWLRPKGRIVPYVILALVALSMVFGLYSALHL